MYVKATIVGIEKGIHARPSAKIVEYAITKPDTDIWIEYPEEGSRASAKSVMDLLMLGVPKNKEVIVKSTGKEEKEVTLHITHIIETFKL